MISRGPPARPERERPFRPQPGAVAAEKTVRQDDPMVAENPAPEVLRMRRELDSSALGPPRWPDGLHVRPFASGDAAALHTLLVHGYLRGGGAVKAYELWLPELTGDAEFDPDLCLLAEADRALAGAALCWTSAFVKDLVVRESWRRRGLGEALLRAVLIAFEARGAPAVDLKVESTNLGAIRLYERVGFRIVERLPFG
jgi:GNAT superfamily N-acetyltransferase